ncbi:glycosyltransferase family 2 protein [uncultured Candidatus Kuenenia sp.]|uniref:glycosyltransferase family 2 protein n=1 Tax=uncultured Candidatus Kuenenia sp. TaxID=1048336 RepID=UPI0003066B5A|nr:glycosyltransferase family 2 protein [uncultured Candidatus Kuenenia sp.]
MITIEYPKITVVTPSYNQAQFLERTILSVLNQNYPNLEYIIIDGGSTDGSVEIIKKYETKLAYWVSEPDRGQSHAINKGWQMSTGQIMAYLNSDDTYRAGALFYIAKYFAEHPEVDMVYGDVYVIDENDNLVQPFICGEFNLKRYIKDCNYYIPQQAVFFRRQIFEKVGLLDENLHFKMDRDYFIRIGINGCVKRIPHYLAHFRTHPAAKSTPRHTKMTLREFISIRRKYGGAFSVPWFYIKTIYLKKMKQLFITTFIITPLKKLHLRNVLSPIVKNMKFRKEIERYEKNLSDE